MSQVAGVFADSNQNLFVGYTDYPILGPDDCIVRVRPTGICGSDCTNWKKGGIGGHEIIDSIRLGHESAGEIVEIGANVKSFKVGDHVSIEPGIACGDCWHCRIGSYNLCPAMKFRSVAPHNGTMAEFISHPAAWLHKLLNPGKLAHWLNP